MNMRRFSIIVLALPMVLGVVAAQYVHDVTLIDHGSFEGDFNGDGAVDGSDFLVWQRQFGTQDKVVCGEKVPAGGDGVCAFRFKGSIGESAKLVQLSSDEHLREANALLERSDGQIEMNYLLYSDSEETNLKTKVVAKYYWDAGFDVQLVKDKTTHTAVGSTASGDIGYFWFDIESTGMLIPQGATLTKVKVLFKNGSLSGKAFADNVLVYLLPQMDQNLIR